MGQHTHTSIHLISAYIVKCLNRGSSFQAGWFFMLPNNVSHHIKDIFIHTKYSHVTTYVLQQSTILLIHTIYCLLYISPLYSI